MIKSKKQMFIVIGVFTLVMLLGTVTYAFFNYTRTGQANNIRTGRIYFNSSQDGRLQLTNVFPIDTAETGIMDDATKVGIVTIDVTGDTTYDNGVEYLVSAVNVTNTVGTKNVPISIDVSTSGTLGTSDDDYFDNRDTSTSHIYKVLANDTISNNDQLMVGYIAKGTTGIDGTITIKAYIDKDKVAITDTYNSDGIPTDINGTTSEWVDGREVFTTTEWNSLSSSGISFQVRVEANEGTWVEEQLSVNTMNLFPSDVFTNEINRNVSEIYFNKMKKSEMESRYNVAEIKADITYNDEGQVLAWLEQDTVDNTKYIMYVASDGETYWTTADINLFYGAGLTYAEKIEFNNVNTSRITSMSYIFYSQNNLKQLDLTSFDTSNVINMSEIVYNSYEIESVNMEGLDLRKAKNMHAMLYGNLKLKSVNLNNVQTRDVENMLDLFYGCGVLKNIDLSGLGGDNLEKFSIGYVNSLEEIDFTNFNFGSSDISSLVLSSNLEKVIFDGANLSNTIIDKPFNSISSDLTVDISNINAQNLSGLFNGYLGSNIKLIGANLDKVNDMTALFFDCSNLTSVDLSELDVSNVQNMNAMFQNCTSLANIDLSRWTTSNIRSMLAMFQNCTSLTTLNLSGLGSDSLMVMDSMFNGCTNLETINMSNFNFGTAPLNAGSNGLFYNLKKLSAIDFTGANTSRVPVFTNMFSGCSSLTVLDLSSFDTSSCDGVNGNVYNMFNGCTNLTTIYVSNLWDMTNQPSVMPIFTGCTSLKGGGTPQTVYDANHVDKEYARIDGGANSSTPGYLTLKTN